MYLCICSDNQSRVECFRYDYDLDRCSLCSAGGQCLHGNRRVTNDFLCICPPCHSGRQCQFSSKLFSLTLEQLLYGDLLSTNRKATAIVLLLFTFVSFILGIPNNLFSFVTFKRPSCRRNGVGHYLFTLSIINQITLTFLCIRLIHLIVSISTPSSNQIVNDAFCKIFSYCLTCLSRTSFWIASLIALERVYTTIFLTKQWFKQPHVARRLMMTLTIAVFLSAAYELVFIRSFSGVDDRSGTTCVSLYPVNHEQLWMIIHQTISIVNFLVPLLINICCTCTIIVIVIRTKMNLHQKNKSKFQFIEHSRVFSSLYFYI